MKSNPQTSLDMLVPGIKDDIADITDREARLDAFQKELEDLLDKTSQRADRVAITSILIQKNLNKIQQHLKLMAEFVRLNKPGHQQSQEKIKTR